MKLAFGHWLAPLVGVSLGLGRRRKKRPRTCRRGEIAFLFVQGNRLQRKGLFLVRGRARVKSQHLGQIEQSVPVIG